MTFNEVPSVKTEENHNVESPFAGVLVTADIHVTHHRSSSSLDVDGERVRRCTIVTSLNAIIQKPTSPCLDIKVFKKQEPEPLVKKSQSSLFEDLDDLPLVRKSKKHTQLNDTNFNVNKSFYKRSQIDRTVLLPYKGCTERHESSKSVNAILAKSSKSWETIKKIDRFSKQKRFYSQTFVTVNPKVKNLNENCLGNDQPTTNKPTINRNIVLKEHDFFNSSYTNVEQPARRFYLIKKSSSSSETSVESKKANIKAIFQTINQLNDKRGQNKHSNSSKLDLHNNITGFEEEIFGPVPKYSLKTTRNVSVLHRPKTRDKSTSTTSLYKAATAQNQDDLLQELLMPYISVGGNYPSEIVLKLVPKREALQSRAKDNPKGDMKSVNSSELNLLAPTLNAITLKENKKSSGILGCFPFIKKSEKEKVRSNGGSNTSNESNKEIYFPALVEVHNKKSRKLSGDTDSEMDSSILHGSFLYEEKKNKNISRLRTKFV